mgnify:CR=1 FL=1|tara:strand:- start:89 stop:685 length:597 start_codon:yes stop_codon:yes gene_type:complete
MELTTMETSKLTALAKKIHKLVDPYVKKGIEVDHDEIVNDLNNVLIALKRFKGKKKEKDPNAPKRAKTAYFFFMEEIRESVKSENPGMKLGEQMKEIGQQWRDLSESKKRKYTDLAEADKKRYAEEMGQVKTEESDGPNYSELIAKVEKGELEWDEVDEMEMVVVKELCKHFKIKSKSDAKKTQELKDLIQKNWENQD